MCAKKFSDQRMQTFYDFKSGKINFIAQTVIPPVNDILLYLNQYAVLYHGHFNKRVFCQKFQQVRQEIIQLLVDLPLIKSQEWVQSNLENAGKYQTVAFIMHMCRLAQEIKWDFPVIANYGSWVNGGSRVFATGMTKIDPWNYVEGLELVKIGGNSHLLDDPVQIQSDEMLHRVFGLDFIFDKTTLSEFSFITELRDNKLYLKNFKNSFDNFNDPNQYPLWDKYIVWRSQYPTTPKIKIYTNWPDQIHNYFKVWDIVEISSGQHIIDEIQGFGNRPGILEKSAQAEHNNPQETVDHVLYVVDPRPIELGDLLIWANLESNVYVESNWKFLLYRKEIFYNLMFIDTSYIIPHALDK
jgi:hypothetical protein